MLRTLILSLLLILPVQAMAADGTKQITWDDLIPQFEPIDNPFDRMDPADLEELGRVVRAREDLELGFLKESDKEYQDALQVEKELLARGVDVPGLLKLADDLRKEVERRNGLVVPALNGKIVRMPGYALPLEQSAGGMTEFLLVPYVGACIHVPPPPPNQIVYVKLKSAYKIASLYEPVWITGRMTTDASSRNLSFVDGAAPIETGYRIEAITIEPYK